MRFYILTSKKIRIYSVFFSSNLPLLFKCCIKKAAHGLKAPCDSSLSSVSVLAGAQLNPQPVHIMGRLDWPSLTVTMQACYLQI